MKTSSQNERNGLLQSEEVNDRLRADAVPPPPEFLETSNRNLGSLPLSKESYISAEVHRLEVSRLWKRVWQVACRARALPRIGDYVTYEIADQSVIIVRRSDSEFAAYHNVCQHRGTRLVDRPGSLGLSGRFVCPFHGWCYSADGKLVHLPRSWDFPEVQIHSTGLKSIRADVWDGWVFVNFDANAEPLPNFIGETLRRHFALWPLSERHLQAHAAKVIPANWKVALEAFLEVYHVATTHPTAGIFANDVATKYDQFDKHGRMHMVKFVAPHGMDEQVLVDRWIGMGLAAGKDAIPQVPSGGRARGVLAQYQRETLRHRTGLDFSRYSDAETLDTLEYLIFPNFAPWGGFGNNLIYRVRPNGNDHESCLFEVMITARDPAGESPPDAPMVLIPMEGSWMDAPGMSGLGAILDEDVSNLKRVQQGLHSDGYTHVNLSTYQEGIIRHLHAVIDDYLRVP
jgi:phenylpropionate dioxygenase-like ring-hydroxylating dioxygenase large terminal subunit